MRGVGEELKGVLDAYHSKNWGALWRFGRSQIETRLSTPEVPVRHDSLRAAAHELGKRVRDFGLAVQGLLRRYREEVLHRQYQQARIADAACDLYASACSLSRLDHLLTEGNH